MSSPDLNGYVAEIRKTGYTVVSNYYTRGKCEAIIFEVDRLLEEYPEFVQTDDVGSDHRVFGAESGSHVIREFYKNSFFQQVGESYMGCETKNLFTLAAKLVPKKDAMGSGRGWHRDSNFRQFKAFLYLADVGIENGPLQLIEGSHRFSSIINDTYRGRLSSRSTRITDGQAEQVINHAPERLKTILAPAGTLILFDSSLIHRGMPIKTGVRNVLFNYYYPTYQLNRTLRDHFEPILKTASA